jgi:glycosyltransferase involved in cell wall biosynthesis
MKILIFIVAYNAEKHILGVLDRIPRSFLSTYNYKILIIDDASTDKTFDVAYNYIKNSSYNITILYNPENLGYGGNQKLGYHYAIVNNFDLVVLLHGDGQYAPEIIEEMVTPVIRDNYDAVLGSRMIKRFEALKGGMPLYKYFGNKILTGIQNRLMKSQLTEFHSGYRCYSVKALRSIPFERNSNDFHFDTQILIQFILKKLKIFEIPIPTYYGNEICHVNGIRYAFNVVNECLKSRLHGYSMFYNREYDFNDENFQYEIKLGYRSSHTMAINAVPSDTRVLDIGCNDGSLGAVLLEKGCYVVGIDQNNSPVKEMINEYYQLNLNKFEYPCDVSAFQFILLLDIIEHLDDPMGFLDYLREKAKLKQPLIICTAPNIGFFVNRIMLLLGGFNYGRQGILDLTHKRLFTFKTLKKLFVQSGYRINVVKGIPAPFPKALGKNFLSGLLIGLNIFFIKISKSFFSYQIYLEAVPTPVVNELLEYSLFASKERTT